jgi:hypothetical protein
LRRPAQHLGDLRVEIEQLGDAVELLLRHFKGVDLSHESLLKEYCELSLALCGTSRKVLPFNLACDANLREGG